MFPHAYVSAASLIIEESGVGRYAYLVNPVNMIMNTRGNDDEVYLIIAFLSSTTCTC